jgi:hypothetical protein
LLCFFKLKRTKDVSTSRKEQDVEMGTPPEVRGGEKTPRARSQAASNWGETTTTIERSNAKVENFGNRAKKKLFYAST